ncbi:hypothetical protein JNB91_19105 [Rhizobium wenxiniae]|uniref:hypothetical protein n=1 Tax=Rhizobium wenxiniae TaxID=1737357 RepID=UPI001C6DFB14|nr:hypothetical protein [Rhizobium wenxiniae]MBW9089928.1 hypothetical protein [Rhizobium wenxiniae]
MRAGRPFYGFKPLPVSKIHDGRLPHFATCRIAVGVDQQFPTVKDTVGKTVKAEQAEFSRNSRF